MTRIRASFLSFRFVRLQRLTLENRILSPQADKRLLRQKRIDHVDAAKSLADMDNYEKKYKMLKLIFDKIFLVTKISYCTIQFFEISAQVFTEVQKSMDEDEWEAGKELPQDEKQRESANREIYLYH